VFVDERLELAAELFGQVFVANGVEERQRRLVRLELGHTPRALGEVVFQILMDLGRQLMLDVVSQEAHEVLALTHGDGNDDY
jgi:hypothetical protein